MNVVRKVNSVETCFDPCVVLRLFFAAATGNWTHGSVPALAPPVLRAMQVRLIEHWAAVHDYTLGQALGQQ